MKNEHECRIGIGVEINDFGNWQESCLGGVVYGELRMGRTVVCGIDSEAGKRGCYLLFLIKGGEIYSPRFGWGQRGE